MNIKIIDRILVKEPTVTNLETLLWELNFYISGYSCCEMVLVSNIYTMAL